MRAKLVEGGSSHTHSSESAGSYTDLDFLFQHLERQRQRLTAFLMEQANYVCENKNVIRMFSYHGDYRVKRISFSEVLM